MRYAKMLYFDHFFLVEAPLSYTQLLLVPSRSLSNLLRNQNRVYDVFSARGDEIVVCSQKEITYTNSDKSVDMIL